MKKILNFYVLLCFLAVAAAFTSCKKTDIPVLTTTAISSITTTSAATGGNITDDGGATVTSKGVCYSTSPNPTLADNFTSDGSGTGIFTSSLAGLSASTLYYVRAYATNAEGTAYGDEMTFKTASK